MHHTQGSPQRQLVGMDLVSAMEFKPFLEWFSIECRKTKTNVLRYFGEGRGAGVGGVGDISRGDKDSFLKAYWKV